MRLVVAKYVPDESHSLDCHLCEQGDKASMYTSLVFYDEVLGTSMTLCPEHLDDVVSVALKRHRDGLKENDPFWYLEADGDPWQE